MENNGGLYIPPEIMSMSLKFLEKGVLAQICFYNNKNGCHASNAHLAGFFGVSEPTIMRTIKTLKEKGLVKQDGWHGKFRKLISLVKLTRQTEDSSQNDSPTLVKLTSDPSQFDQHKGKRKEREIRDGSACPECGSDYWQTNRLIHNAGCKKGGLKYE